MNGKQALCVLIIIIVALLLSLPACVTVPAKDGGIVVMVDRLNHNVCYSLYQKSISCVPEHK